MIRSLCKSGHKLCSEIIPAKMMGAQAASWGQGLSQHPPRASPSLLGVLRCLCAARWWLSGQTLGFPFCWGTGRRVLPCRGVWLNFFFPDAWLLLFLVVVLK